MDMLDLKVPRESDHLYTGQNRTPDGLYVCQSIRTIHGWSWEVLFRTCTAVERGKEWVRGTEPRRKWAGI